MPRDHPIRGGGLVKVDGADGQRFGADVWSNEIQQVGGMRQLCHDGHPKNLAPARVGGRAEARKQPLQMIRPEQTRDDGESVVLNIVTHLRVARDRHICSTRNMSRFCGTSQLRAWVVAK